VNVTRRDLLYGALAGGGATLGLALSPEAARADPTELLRGATSDGELVSRLLGFEQLEEFAYRHIEQSSVLPARARVTVTRFLGHERRHAELLAAAVARHGATAPTPPASLAAADRELAALGVSGSLDRVRDESSAIRLLIGVETAAEEVYYGSIERFSSTTLLALAPAILGCEAQHWTGLSALLHLGDPGIGVPHAFAPLVGQFSA
jgi:ferritin-like protein